MNQPDHILIDRVGEVNSKEIGIWEELGITKAQSGSITTEASN
jgi:hypothetical protein